MMNKVFYDLVRSAPAGRWNGILRNYGPEEVSKLRSGVQIEYTLAVGISTNLTRRLGLAYLHVRVTVVTSANRDAFEEDFISKN